MIGLGSALGAFAGSGQSLLAARIVESCGFLGVVIGVPALIRSLAAPADRDLALALWGAYLPAGSAIMMLGGPYLAAFGWQALWAASATASPA
jgi:MFS family permease